MQTRRCGKCDSANIIYTEEVAYQFSCWNCKYTTRVALFSQFPKRIGRPVSEEYSQPIIVEKNSS